MNTEEVYRSLRKTTAEIQNYSFETKLGRDTNSKDSGISQMDDQQSAAVGVMEPPIQQQHHYYALQQPQQHQQFNSNGYNGHTLLSNADKDDSCNGSKTQSATTTESNTPENTVRMDNEINANRNTFTPKHSNNVTFLPNGELVTECKYCQAFSDGLIGSINSLKFLRGCQRIGHRERCHFIERKHTAKCNHSNTGRFIDVHQIGQL